MTIAEEKQSAPSGAQPSWKHHPYVAVADDPELVFPAAEGDQGAESNTWYVAGRLSGVRSHREWAFLVIFTHNDIRHRLRADFYTFALFDLATGDYGTFTELDLPWPPRLGRPLRLEVARGHLDVAFATAEGRAAWSNRRTAEGELVPFEYGVDLRGRDARGRPMRLVLDLDARKPPLPVGGREYGGVKTCMGQHGTHSYFQSDVRFAGRLEWGEVAEEVEGDSGWIDRQWAPRYLGVHTDRRNTRYRHEWRQIHLESGFEMSVWLHHDRHRGNRPIPFTGATAATPEGEVIATTEVEIERLSFVRDPGVVAPLFPLTKGARYLADRYRLRVPAWDLEVFSEPLVPAPAHRLPIEYWSGPTRIAASMAGKGVAGFGFHERTLVWSRDFELVDVLRQTLRHLPESAFPKGSPGPLALADRAWELDAFLSHGDRRAASSYLQERLRPDLDRLAPPDRDHVLGIAADLDASLARPWYRRPR